MNPRGGRTAVFLLCAAVLVVFASEVRPVVFTRRRPEDLTGETEIPQDSPAMHATEV